ncbi:hypothetical protein KQX54_004166 [Cotesia glomerata]|uniref:Uncharacterized protein n=1 Tax=Cotesia glomerata TaxID=32391 RepID=A0AAV7INI6_COTGL|nr:hypothetical protein KQX54_004166 [Cotesia glomerata]
MEINLGKGKSTKQSMIQNLLRRVHNILDRKLQRDGQEYRNETKQRIGCVEVMWRDDGSSVSQLDYLLRLIRYMLAPLYFESTKVCSTNDQAEIDYTCIILSTATPFTSPTTRLPLFAKNYPTRGHFVPLTTKGQCKKSTNKFSRPLNPFFPQENEI